mmetsp:Transcript_43625/g.102564  ORF Transcript_43625/g.102564 Transcript_43625/m.102564 type:complete len:210 (-) Transcript_43625:157-786(-)
MSKQRKRRHDQVEENPSYQENVASIGPRPGPKASNKGGQDGHIETLMTKFSAKTRTTKEIEATVPGEPKYSVETWLPSSFDYYPSIKHKATELRHQGKLADALKLLRDFEKFLLSGDVALLPNDAEGVIDVDAQEEQPERWKWQVNCGEDGWKDFDQNANDIVEAALAQGKETVEFPGFRGAPYTLHFELLLQTNLRSGYSRPVRRHKL